VTAVDDEVDGGVDVDVVVVAVDDVEGVDDPASVVLVVDDDGVDELVDELVDGAGSLGAVVPGAVVDGVVVVDSGEPAASPAAPSVLSASRVSVVAGGIATGSSVWTASLVRKAMNCASS
jgi:hypothetical protein